MFTLTINTDNAAFEDKAVGFEVARILHALANDLEDCGPDHVTKMLRDINGNTVGSWTLEPRSE